MRFAFSDDQRLLQRTVRELLEKECTPQHVRAGGRIPGLWRKLSEIGVPALTVSARRGGLGLGMVDLVLLLEEAGRAALPEPVVETVAVAAPILARAGGHEWLPLIASGDATASVAVRDGFAAYAEDASVVLVQRGDDVAVVARDDASLVPQPSLDPTRPLHAVSATLRGATVIPGAAAEAFDRAAFGAAALLLGVAERVIEMAAAYAKERRQFGQPIGAFQAVKHLLASAFVRVEFARPVVYRAALTLDDDASPDRARDASHAKAAASEAATTACRAALQAHGAIGYTEEHDLHVWLRRGWALASAYGDASWHRDRLATLVL
jgi:alkylation response protein AidB-like acyl-CoA dehydrogenase